MLRPPTQEYRPIPRLPNYYPNYTPPQTFTVATGDCCDVTWLYMTIAVMLGGIIGYAVHTHSKKKE